MNELTMIFTSVAGDEHFTVKDVHTLFMALSAVPSRSWEDTEYLGGLQGKLNRAILARGEKEGAA